MVPSIVQVINMLGNFAVNYCCVDFSIGGHLTFFGGPPNIP